MGHLTDLLLELRGPSPVAPHFPFSQGFSPGALPDVYSRSPRCVCVDLSTAFLSVCAGDSLRLRFMELKGKKDWLRAESRG